MSFEYELIRHEIETKRQRLASRSKEEIWRDTQIERVASGLHRELRAIDLWRIVCHLLHAVPWVTALVFGCFANPNDLGWATGWLMLFWLILGGLFHGTMAVGPFGFYRAIRFWRSDWLRRRNALKSFLDYERWQELLERFPYLRCDG